MPDSLPQPPFARYEIGIEEIDAQHRELFALLAELESFSGKGFSPEAARDALSRLSNFANVHFAVEESLMRMLGYPDILAHVAEHQRFRKQLADFQQRLLDGDIAGQLHRFIANWLANHIDVTDRKYVPHFLASRIDPKGR